MGGSNETKIDGLRFHVSGNDVHVHGDSATRKFRLYAFNFKEDLSAALETLKNQDGVVKIKGQSTTDLYVVKDGGDVSLFLTGDGSVKRQLQSFMKNC